MTAKPRVSERRARTRERLIEAASELVIQRGFHSTTVDQIAERAGLSIGALYSNFTGKDELFFAVIDEHLRWFREEVARVRDASDRALAISSWIGVTGDSTEQLLIYIEFWAYAVRRPKVRRQFARRMAEMRSHVADAIAEAATAEGFEPMLPPELVALLLLATGRGLGLEKLVDPDAVPEPTIGALLAQFVTPTA